MVSDDLRNKSCELVFEDSRKDQDLVEYLIFLYIISLISLIINESVI